MTLLHFQSWNPSLETISVFLGIALIVRFPDALRVRALQLLVFVIQVLQISIFSTEVHPSLRVLQKLLCTLSKYLFHLSASTHVPLLT